MALTKDMNLQQIESFLGGELKEQIFLEIAPLLYIGQPVGGYFGVTRQVLCFLDFLGAAYCGYDGKDKYSDGAKRISTPEKTLKFLEEILGEIDGMYKQNGKYLYVMYRHGLVHLYEPRTVKQQNSRVLKWAAYKGSRRDASITFQADSGSVDVQTKHLGIVNDPRDSQSDFLTVSITCLYKDLLTAVDMYRKRLSREDELIKNWKLVADAIAEPEDYSVIEKLN